MLSSVPDAIDGVLVSPEGEARVEDRFPTCWVGSSGAQRVPHGNQAVVVPGHHVAAGPGTQQSAFLYHFSFMAAILNFRYFESLESAVHISTLFFGSLMYARKG